MKDKTIVFYDNTDDYEKYDDAKQTVFESFKDSNDWTDINDVPNKMIWDEIAAQNEAEWEYLSQNLTELLNGNHYIIMGTCGRWNGPVSCGTFIESFNELLSFLSHLDRIRMYERNGHFYIDGYHHDGHDHYELKRLTDKGVEYADRHCFARDKTLHHNIMTCNLFSALPRIADAVFGIRDETKVA